MSKGIFPYPDPCCWYRPDSQWSLMWTASEALAGGGGPWEGEGNSFRKQQESKTRPDAWTHQVFTLLAELAALLCHTYPLAHACICHTRFIHRPCTEMYKHLQVSLLKKWPALPKPSLGHPVGKHFSLHPDSSANAPTCWLLSFCCIHLCRVLPCPGCAKAGSWLVFPPPCPPGPRPCSVGLPRSQPQAMPWACPAPSEGRQVPGSACWEQHREPACSKSTNHRPSEPDRSARFSAFLQVEPFNLHFVSLTGGYYTRQYWKPC